MIFFSNILARVPALVSIDSMYLDHKRPPFVLNCLLISKSLTFLSPSTYTAFFELRYVDRHLCSIACGIWYSKTVRIEVQCLSLEYPDIQNLFRVCIMYCWG